MERSLGNPFREDHKPRKPGVAGLVGDMFGESAKTAYEKRVGGEKKQRSALVPQEDWGGGDIEMTAAEKTNIQAEKEHVRLHNVPTFSKFPTEDDMMEEFKFDSMWSDEYREGRSIADFVLTDSGLENIGLGEQLRVRIMEAMSAQKEAPPLVKIFDIGDLIRQKQRADPYHPNTLSTKEVFEAIDAAGYRPATLLELIAYGRDFWKPDVVSDSLTDEEAERLRLANTPRIYALGSLFSCSDGGRDISFLNWFAPGRDLRASASMRDWRSDCRFLVVRK